MKFLKLLLVLALSISQNLFAQHTHDKPSDHYSPFIENMGQWDEEIKFRSDFAGGRIFLHKNKMRFGFLNHNDLEILSTLYHDHSERGKNLLEQHIIHGHIYEMEFIGSNKNPNVSTLEKQSNYHNYFLGNDKSKWAENVGLYGHVIYSELWDGVDFKMKESKGSYEYDFIVKPGADIQQIKLRFTGQDFIEVKDGKLLITTSVNTVIENAPYVYQQINGKQQKVACRYALNDGVLGFEFPEGYNPAYEVIIDPLLIFSTYSGSTADNWGYSATYDNEGNYYGGSITSGIGYPITPGAFQESFGGGPWDIAITKYNPQGTAQVYSTFLGGNGDDRPHSLIVDSQGRLIVYGSTSSNNFPIPFQSSFDNTFNGDFDIFITKFSSGGSSIVGSTYIGGSGLDGRNNADLVSPNYGDSYRGEVMIDDNDNIYVASFTSSSDFPVLGSGQNSYQGSQDGCVFKATPDLSTMVWSTYLGGSGQDAGFSIRPGNTNEVFICGGTNSSDFPTTAGTIQPTYQGGVDGFVININNTTGAFNYATYLGTSAYDQGYFLDIDNQGDVYVFGQTKGASPVSPGVYSNPNGSQFIHKMTPDLSTSILSTVFGSGESTIDISPTAFSLGICDNILISGWGGGFNSEGNTAGLPITPDAFQTETDGSGMYFMALEKDFEDLIYATHFGGSGSGEHVDGGTSRFDKNGILYQAICACGGSGMPTTPGAWSESNGSGCNLGSVKMEMCYEGVFTQIIMNNQGTACALSEIEFASSGNGVEFIWYFGDGSPVDTNENPTHTYTDTGTYLVSLIAIDTSLYVSSDTAYISVTIFPESPINAEFSLDLNCLDKTINVVSEVSGFENMLYEWVIEGAPFSLFTESVFYTFNEPGIYDISHTVTDTLCALVASTTQQVFISEEIELLANFNYTPDFSDSLIYFTNTGTSGLSAESYFWNFGDGSTSLDGETPTHFYTSDGTYNVTEIITNSSYCNPVDSITFPVIVDFGLTSIVDLEKENLIVYKHQNKLELRSSEKNIQVELVLYNTNGLRIKSYNLHLDNSGKSSIDLPVMAKGIYLVHYKSKDLQKVVKFVY